MLPRVLIVAAAALILTVIAYLALAPGGDTEGSVVRAAACTPAVTGDRPARIVARVKTGRTPWALATNGSSLWVLKRSWPAGTAGVVRIDPARNKVVSAVRLDTDTWDIAYGGGYVWVTMNGRSGDVWRVGARGESVRLISGGRIVLGSYITYGAGAAWTGNNDERFGHARTVTRIDPRTLRVGRPIWTRSDIEAIEAADTGLWVGDHAAGILTRIDPLEQRVTNEVRLGGAPHSLATRGRFVWVGLPHEQSVALVDSRARPLAARTIKVRVEAAALSATPTGAWVVERSEELDVRTTRLVHVDAASRKVSATLAMAGSAADALRVRGALWVARPAEGDVVRIC